MINNNFITYIEHIDMLLLLLLLKPVYYTPVNIPFNISRSSCAQTDYQHSIISIIGIFVHLFVLIQSDNTAYNCNNLSL